MIAFVSLEVFLRWLRSLVGDVSRRREEESGNGSRRFYKFC